MWWMKTIARAAAILLSMVMAGFIIAAESDERLPVITPEEGEDPDARHPAVLVFPRVIAGGSGDTVVQITNTSKSHVVPKIRWVPGNTTEGKSEPVMDPAAESETNPTATRPAANPPDDRSGSIVIFPKVIADGTRDTVIQITNTSKSLVVPNLKGLKAGEMVRNIADGKPVALLYETLRLLSEVMSDTPDVPTVGALGNRKAP